MELTELKAAISLHRRLYTMGSPIVSDEEYDKMMKKLEELSPNDELLSSLDRYAPDDEDRMELLPVPMFSLVKIKSLKEFDNWVKREDIPADTQLVLSPKYDGLAMCVDEDTGGAWTSGNGTKGQRSTDRFSYMPVKSMKDGKGMVTFGEAIMKKASFSKYEGQYENARNIVSGQMNSKQFNKGIMCDVEFIRYGISGRIAWDEYACQSDIIKFLNGSNRSQVPYLITTVADIVSMGEDGLVSFMKELFDKWGTEYEIDGIVIDVDNVGIRGLLGRKKDGNPRYAVAFKGHFEDVAVTCVNDIEYQVSKQGFLKPVVIIDPVRLNGVTVSRVSGYNCKNVLENGIGIGAVVSVKRSGAVIPKIIAVHNEAEPNLPSSCPECGKKTEWNESGVELVCPNNECVGKVLKRAVAFFKIMGTDFVDEGTVKKFFEAGFNSVYRILRMNQEDMAFISGFGHKKARKIWVAIQESITDIPIERLQHASGCFDGIGEETFKVINEAIDNNVRLDSVAGIGSKTVADFFSGCHEFLEVAKRLNMITIKKDDPVVVDGTMRGFVVAMTGFRDKELEELIKAEGGKISDGVTKATTHLLSAEVGSGTRKEATAFRYGIPVMTKDDFLSSINE